MKKYWKPLFAIVIFLLMQLAAGIFLYAGKEFVGLNDANAIALATILSGLITVGILFALHMIRPKTFNPKRIKWGQAPIAFMAALLGILAMDLLSDQLNLPDIMKEEFGEMAKSVWGIIAIAIVGPIVEELVFREAVTHSLLEHCSHRWQAVLLSALAFGLIHINPAQVPFAFVMGIILAIIYVKTRSIVLISIIHIINNSLAVIEINVLGEDIDKFHYSDLLGGKAFTWFFIFVCAILSIAFLSQFWEKYHRHRH